MKLFGGHYARQSASTSPEYCHNCRDLALLTVDAAITVPIISRRCAIANCSGANCSPSAAATPPEHSIHTATRHLSESSGHSLYFCNGQLHLRPVWVCSTCFVTCLLTSSGPAQNNRGPCYSSVVDVTEHPSSTPAHFFNQQGTRTLPTLRQP